METQNLSAEALSDLVKNRDSGSLERLKNELGGSEGIAKYLETDTQKGLTSEQVHSKEREAKFGTNRLKKVKAKNYFWFWIGAFKDKTLVILLIAATASIILGESMPPPGEDRSTSWIEGTAILGAVVIVATVTATNDYMKDRQFRRLSEEAENRKIKVIRDAKQQVISIYDVAVGELVILETGDYIPCDILLLSGQGLTVDESPMTGEPEAVHKGEDDPFMIGGCMVTAGANGRGVAVAVGKNSQWGRIKGLLEKPESKTPLQQRLELLAERIGKFGVAAAALTFIALILEWSIRTYGIAKKPWEWSDLSDVVDFIITAIAIIVVAVPEGLPLAVTLSLAYSMVRMMKDQNLVRHLTACETMGGATQICSDKTGTLTQNRMTVVKFWLSNHRFDQIPTQETAQLKEVHQENVKLWMEAMCINSTAYLEKPENSSDIPKVVGTKTEGALLMLAQKLGTNYDELRKGSHVAQVYPFSSKKKRMSTVVESEHGKRLHCKGASEKILELCNRMMEGEKPVELTGEKKEELSHLIEEWASQGYRTLGIGYKELEQGGEVPEETEESLGPLDTDLILLAIIAIEDPIRPEVPASVGQCRSAGIVVRMLTGDNILTAKKIARQCGIFKDGDEALEGPQFRQLSQDQLDEIIPKLKVVARCSPEDKLILVKRLRERGEVVACTGDGSNDAPILREADVGFAMGISGTEVAKEASDIVLLDDNFSSIEKAVLWGRNVYDSIRKFIQFQLTVNIVAVIVAFVGAVSQGESPLRTVQMLWVNLIMDTLAALALATQKPTPDLLNRPPYGRNSSMITWKMWRQIIGQAVFQLTVLFFTLYGAHLIPFLGVDRYAFSRVKVTILFNTFVFCQLFNEFNCRSLGDEWNIFKGITQNWVFLAVMGTCITVQVIIVEFGGSFTETEHLNIYQWLYCLGIGFFSIPFGFLLRLIPVPAERISAAREETQPLLSESQRERV